MILTVLLAWFGWAFLDDVPIALALSQLPAATTLLAWAAEHADRVELPAWPRPRTVHAETPTTEQVA